MKTINIPGVSFPVSQICLGTAFFNSEKYVPKDRSFELMDYYFRQGGRFFNTAHEYGNGLSELCLGEWVRTRGVRDQVILTSKGGEDATRIPHCRAMRREELLEDIDESLERMGLEYLDFYMLHLDDPSVSVEEIVGTMEDIKNAGKIRYYGSSNWSPERQREAAAYAKKMGYQGFVIDEIEYSVARSNNVNENKGIKWLDESFVELHEEDGMCVGAYSALAHGIFQKYAKNGSFEKSGGLISDDGWYKIFSNPYNREVAERLVKLSKETGWSVVQIQLAWLADHPHNFPCFSIIGASKIYQLEDSLAASDITLTPDMISYLVPDRREFPDGVDLIKAGKEFPF